MSNSGDKKSSKLANLFSGGHSTSKSTKESSSSLDEEDENEHLLEDKKASNSHKTCTRSRSVTPGNDYATLKEATKAHPMEEKLKRRNSVGQKISNMTGGSSSKTSSVSKKHVLQMEVNLLTQLNEQNDRLIEQNRLIMVLQDHNNRLDARVTMLEKIVKSNILRRDEQEEEQRDEGCTGNWFASMFT